MTELKKVRVGVVGVGALGQWHAKNYAALPGAELAGVYDIDAGRASEIAMRYNTRTFASIEELAEMLARPSIIAGLVMLAVVAALFAWVLTRPHVH